MGLELQPESNLEERLNSSLKQAIESKVSTCPKAKLRDAANGDIPNPENPIPDKTPPLQAAGVKVLQGTDDHYAT